MLDDQLLYKLLSAEAAHQILETARTERRDDTKPSTTTISTQEHKM